MTEMTEENTETEPDETYSEMFRDYLALSDNWIGPAELPLVFHLKKLCRQLDNDGLDKAALASAYLQAFARLDKRRPGAPQGPAGSHPDQTSIFDELD